MKEKEYEIISSVLERPGMYVGKARVDYLQHFLNGFLMNGEINNEDSNWRSWSYLLEKWLFYKESVSIAHSATINGWEVLKRCYGNDKNGCDQLKEFFPYFKAESQNNCLNQISVDDTVSHHIYQIYSHYHWER